MRLAAHRQLLVTLLLYGIRVVLIVLDSLRQILLKALRVALAPLLASELLLHPGLALLRRLDVDY